MRNPIRTLTLFSLLFSPLALAQADRCTPFTANAPAQQIVSTIFGVRDFNADGIPDLAATTGVAMQIVFGRGDGTFASRFESTVVPGGQYAIRTPRIADIDGDGDDDLVAVAVNLFDDEDLIVVGFNDGAGRLTEQRAIFTSTSLLEIVAVGDFNEDGADDVVVRTEASGTLVITRTGGSFAATPAAQSAIRPTEAVGDFDGDGNLDLVANEGVQTQLYVFHGDGSGRFPRRTALATTATHAISADLDGDGRDDVIALEANGSLAIFDAPIAEGTTPRRVALGFEPLGAAVEDFNSDGVNDLAVLLHHRATGARRAVVYLSDGRGGFFARGEASTGPNGTSLHGADFDRDGNVDLFIPGGALILGNGNGSLRAPRRITSPADFTIVDAADLNGDSVDELILFNGSALRVNADEVPGAVSRFEIGVGNFHVTHGRELAVATGTRARIIARPAQIWEEVASIETGRTVEAIEAGELDAGSPGDEIVIATTTPGMMYVEVRSAAGTKLDESAFPSRSGDDEIRMELADVNGDGRLDVVFSESGFTAPDANVAGYVAIFRGEGDGRISERIFVDVVIGLNDLSVGDFDRDGRTDIVVATDPENVFVFEQNESGAFIQRTVGSRAGHRHDVADINGDGFPDLVVQAHQSSQGAGLRVFHGSANGLPFVPQIFVIAASDSDPVLARRTPFALPSLAMTLDPTTSWSLLVESTCAARRRTVRH